MNYSTCLIEKTNQDANFSYFTRDFIRFFILVLSFKNQIRRQLFKKRFKSFIFIS